MGVYVIEPMNSLAGSSIKYPINNYYRDQNGRYIIQPPIIATNVPWILTIVLKPHMDPTPY